MVENDLLEELLRLDVDGALDSPPLSLNASAPSGGESIGGLLGDLPVYYPLFDVDLAELPKPAQTTDADSIATMHIPTGLSILESKGNVCKVGAQPSDDLGCSDKVKKTEAGDMEYNRVAKGKIHKNAQNSRKRPKDELEYLRAKSYELEFNLEQLKKRDQIFASPLPSSPEIDGNGVGNTSSSNSGTPSVWKRVARSQFEGKQKAEQENARLKQLLEGQLEIVKGLEKVLRKRSAIQQTDSSLADDRKRVRVEHESETSIFEMLIRGLDEQYLETECVFKDNTVAAQKIEIQNAQIKIDMTSGMYMEFLDSKIVPFALREVEDATWRVFARSEMKLKDGYYGVVNSSDNIKSAKLVKTLKNQHLEALMDAKFVIKRYTEGGRIVLVWACQTDTEGAVSKIRGVRWFDRGWTIVEPLTSADDDSNGGCSSIIQSCARVRPELPSVPVHKQQDIILLTDLATGSFLQNLGAIHQAVEDLLVEEALKR